MSESRKLRIPLREWRSKQWEEERERRLENLATEERDTETIAGKFAEALGCIEDAWNYLRQINEQYDPEQPIDLTCNPRMDFWLQAEKAQDALWDMLSRLQRVEPLAPKEEAASV